MACTVGKEHERPVHFNRGRHGHLWICISCGRQLAGPKINDDEREALVAFTLVATEEFKSRKGQTARKEQRREQMETTKMTFTFEGTPTPAAMAARLRFQAGLLEGMDAKAAASRKNTDTAPAAVDTEEETEDFAPAAKKTAAKKKPTPAASFDSDDDAPVEEPEAEAEAEEQEDFTTPAAKAPAKKAKKLTVDDVNDACKVRAAHTGGKEGRTEVLAILKKNFRTTSVSELKPEQYAAVIKAMEV